MGETKGGAGGEENERQSGADEGIEGRRDQRGGENSG